MAISDKEILLDIKDKVEKLNDEVHDMNIVLVKQEINLKDHMERTSINEQKLELFEEQIAPALDAYKFVATLLKFIIPIVTIIGVYIQYRDLFKS